MDVSTPLIAGPARAIPVDLFRHAQAGCPDSLNHLMAEHDRLVHAVIRRQVLGTLPFAEALQAGRIGLWRAILGYDPQRGLAFSTYAWPCIAREVWSAVKGAQRPGPTVLCTLVAFCCAVDPVTACDDTAVRSALHDLVARLPAHLRTIVVAHYGLDGEPPASFGCIGARVGLSKQRVHQLHMQALIWLRQPAHAQHLRSLLGRHTLADYESAQAQADAWLGRQRRRHGR
jgi:RNA polymerase sigma factor (sigma-70 family)